MKKLDVSEDFIIRAQKIKLLLMDCDGVLTDGRLYFSERGEELKVFHVRDGQGLSLWHAAGFESGIISGRNAAKIIRARATELGIAHIKTSSVDKVKDFEDILSNSGISPEDVAYVGDDIGDLGLMKKVGFPIAVADAVENVLTNAKYITSKNGGMGAVREVIDLLLHYKQNF